jgi:hypothetical protein
MSKNITQKIRELLTPEDLKIFEGAVEGMIDDKVKSKLSDLIQLKEEELKVKYDALAEAYVKKTVSEMMIEKKAKLVESYDKKLALLEQKVVTKLDSYLNHVISEQISDAMLEKIAINETLMPVVEGIRAVFTDNHLKINSKAQSAMDSLSDEIKSIKSELSESIDKRIMLETELERSAVYLLIAEKTNGFKRSDKQKVIDMFKDKEFDEVDKNIDNYLGLIKESTSIKSNKITSKTTVKQKPKSVNEGVVIDAKKSPVKAVDEDVEPTLSEMANRYF